MKSETPEPDRNTLALDRTRANLPGMASNRSGGTSVRVGRGQTLERCNAYVDTPDNRRLADSVWCCGLFTGVPVVHDTHVPMYAWRTLDIDATPMWLDKVVSILLAGCSILAFSRFTDNGYALKLCVLFARL
ncbi:hypothetical protein MNBD_GAMMA13-12 [hydrothermal vent metagenome]|uniref:Uncharacterized protein n=1 Tax=hydrothermal vent metagenome TaxID=652676 RepID=A0A3B0YLF7_9ZZZZ